MKVLLVTKSDDNESVALVGSALLELGAEPVRFDTDHYPPGIRLSRRTSNDGRDGDLVIDGVRHALDEFDSVWHRRLAIGARIPADMDAQLRGASLGEARRVLLGALAALDAFVLDPRERLESSSNKEMQLDLAREVGLDVPRTLVSNDPDAVRAFADELGGAIVTKMMSSFAVYEEGREQVVFTNPVTAADLADLDGLRFCPMTFQETLRKSVELRVTVVGERVFAASIDSQALDGSRHDWRREGTALMEEWREYELPEGVRTGLLAMMERLGLNYGAADFVVTPEGRCVFLEINPSGEFFWLERVPGFPISRCLAEVLTGAVERR
ncbi:MAG: MvdD family ATP-grasp ribosomal peptide maturase [Planctomycetota bacterium]